MPKLIPDETKNARITIRTGESKKALFDQRCREKGLNSSIVLNLLIDKWFKENCQLKL